MHLPDINVWLALAFEVHVHHWRAVEWLGRAATGSCAFCRLTQQGFLRLATNPSVFGDEALTLKRASLEDFHQAKWGGCKIKDSAYRAKPTVVSGRNNNSSQEVGDVFLGRVP